MLVAQMKSILSILHIASSVAHSIISHTTCGTTKTNGSNGNHTASLILSKLSETTFKMKQRKYTFYEWRNNDGTILTTFLWIYAKSHLSKLLLPRWKLKFLFSPSLKRKKNNNKKRRDDEDSNIDNTLEERNLHKLMKKKFAVTPYAWGAMEWRSLSSGRYSEQWFSGGRRNKEVWCLYDANH
jgi:hypothetical protein